MSKNLRLGIVGLGRLGTITLEKLIEYSSILDFNPQISLVSEELDQQQIDKIIKEKDKYSGKITKVCVTDIDQLEGCDFIIYDRAFGNTPYWFEEFNYKGMGILFDKYREFLKGCKNEFHADGKKPLDFSDYERLFGWAEPIFFNEHANKEFEEFELLKARKECLREKNEVPDNDFDSLKKAITDCWLEHYLNGDQKNSQCLPEVVFDPMCKTDKKFKGIPDVVFEDYAREFTEFLDNQNREKKQNQEHARAFEIYKIMRGVKNTGYRALRFLPYAICPSEEGKKSIIEDARILAKYKNSVIFVVTNPTDEVCEIMHRAMGKGSEKRIVGVNCCDPARHVTEIKNILRSHDVDVEVVEADTVGKHDSTVVIDHNIKISGYDNEIDKYCRLQIYKSEQETKRVNRMVATYPARNPDSYTEVVYQLLSCIMGYAKGKAKTNSTRIVLSKAKAYEQKNLIKNKKMDKGGFLGLKLKILNRSSDDTPKWEAELAWDSLQMSDYVLENLATGYDAEIELMHKLEEKKFIPPVPEMPGVFDLGTYLWKMGDELLRFNVSSTSWSAEKLGAISLNENSSGFLISENGICCFENRLGRAKNCSIYMKGPDDRWQETHRFEKCKIDYIKKIRDKTFMEYTCGNTSQVDLIDLESGKRKNIKDLKSIICELDNEKILGSKYNGIWVLIDGNTLECNDLEKYQTISSVGAKKIDGEDFFAVSTDAGNVVFWSTSTLKRIGIEFRTGSKYFELMKYKSQFLMYTLNSDGDVVMKSYDKKEDLWEGKNHKTEKLYKMEGRKILGLFSQKDIESKNDNLVILTEREVEVLTPELAYQGKVQFDVAVASEEQLVRVKNRRF